ncbi:hypothetical protein H1P_3850004 [Hyella patelloides LEGE 07179]|uniref:Rad50/SbcC-type AAA domain-containing protein n=1 Tax=Hyella patelloides LEGE 07179 TaxID=945734 RepID=A0A563VWT1_9CYAN|nr:hypothetical protein [Hyella patelloides]VEP15912.1 hypothetical protein H1P_3850004 [Hyella patelloides LEGE 07179]
MFLHRIQVPDFRALKDIDITFEPEFSPSIFPLSSLNGGGKSTLLQLIFILLSCSGDPEKHIFIQNMLEGFKFNADEKIKTLAILKIIHDKHIIFLTFECYQYKFIDAHIKDNFRISLAEFINSRSNINDREIFKDTQLICSCQDRKGNQFILLCIIEQNFSQRIDIIFNKISEKVFLAAPLTQFCHFLRISGNFHNQVFFNQKKTEYSYYSKITSNKKSY